MGILLMWIVAAAQTAIPAGPPKEDERKPPATPAQDARLLVQMLRSESVEEREEAERKLKAIGRPALPELEKAAKAVDAEAAERAKHLLRVIPVMEALTPNILRRIPGIEERLALKETYWGLSAFSEVESSWERRRHSGLKKEDLELVALAGLRRSK